MPYLWQSSWLFGVLWEIGKQLVEAIIEIVPNRDACWPRTVKSRICRRFNPFYIGPYPERACGDCPYGEYSGFTRCGWSGGNGPFGTTFCDSRYGGGGGGRRCGSGGGCGGYGGGGRGRGGCGPSCGPRGGGSSWCPGFSPYYQSPCEADSCMMCSSGFGCCGQSCRTSCYSCC
ncbi:small cysteine and glycine repeat-containing protein 2 isoform X1 [Drosophila teissieri]|uniref:small cysteine and glycine repeat-containing protein 2 isoform X1 n=1 Tax=Drosophila teissieri TaxID=7243 RepID=UPI001CBA4C74|nr:small cysteine and glycine repeat-containing protein 2 isoform X1 [Drosophila teissieri]